MDAYNLCFRVDTKEEKEEHAELQSSVQDCSHMITGNCLQNLEEDLVSGSISIIWCRMTPSVTGSLNVPVCF